MHHYAPRWVGGNWKTRRKGGSGGGGDRPENQQVSKEEEEEEEEEGGAELNGRGRREIVVRVRSSVCVVVSGVRCGV